MIILFVFFFIRLKKDPYVEKNTPDNVKYNGILNAFNDTSKGVCVEGEQQWRYTTNNIAIPFAKSINSIRCLPLCKDTDGMFSPRAALPGGG